MTEKILFRPHRGSLDEAMKEVVKIDSFEVLLNKVITELAIFPHNLEINKNTLTIKAYPDEDSNHDKRIGWDTYIVFLRGYGVIGFTNGKF